MKNKTCQIFFLKNKKKKKKKKTGVWLETSSHFRDIAGVFCQRNVK
jgi:hypothetical protein